MKIKPVRQRIVVLIKLPVIQHVHDAAHGWARLLFNVNVFNWEQTASPLCLLLLNTLCNHRRVGDTFSLPI